VSRFEQILESPSSAAPAATPRAAAAPARGSVGNRVENITLDKETQDQYWKSVLTNAYFLRCPARDAAGNRSFIPMRSLYEVLERLQQGGAGLARVEEQPRPGILGLRRPGKISRLKLEQGVVPQAEWNRIRAEELPKHKDQLRWLFTLSVMGAAVEYVDLGAELPREWMEDALGKHGARIGDLRREVLEEMVDRLAAGKSGRVCFEVGDCKIYCLVPGKTGMRMAGGRPVVELTPEEAVLVAEAQEAGLLAAGAKGAQGALKWAN